MVVILTPIVLIVVGIPGLLLGFGSIVKKSNDLWFLAVTLGEKKPMDLKLEIS